MELDVFDENFNRIHVVDQYTDIEFTHKYHDHSSLSAIVDATEENVKYFLGVDELRILTKSSDHSRGFIVESAEYRDASQTDIVILAKSLSILTQWRIIEWQQRYTGLIESVIKGFVNANMINTTLARKIPNLILSIDTGINIQADEMYNNKQLDESLWEICKKHDVSFEILMDHKLKKFVFVVYKGKDRSTNQSVNPRVIFSKEFDNVNTQSYIDDKSNYKSTAYVAGEGEGLDRKVIKLNDNFSGLKRREIFFDARDLQSKYQNEDNVEITIPPGEYDKLLIERGSNRLSEYKRVRTFESEIDQNSQFVFNEDYFLGDKVTSRNDEIGIINHSAVSVVKEAYTEDGYFLNIEFGDAVPTLIDKIRREMK